jgi:hypothetical protein
VVSCVLITDILLDVGGALDVVDELSMSGPDYNLVAWLFVSLLFSPPYLCLLLAVSQLYVVIFPNGLPWQSRRQEFGYELVT